MSPWSRGGHFTRNAFPLHIFIIFISTSIYFIVYLKCFGIGLRGIKQQPATDSRPNSTSVQNFLDDGIDLDSELHL